jgi:hypothetical protein
MLLVYPSSVMRSTKFRLVAASWLLAVVAGLLSYRLLRPTEARVQRHKLTGYVLEITPEMNSDSDLAVLIDKGEPPFGHSAREVH